MPLGRHVPLGLVLYLGKRLERAMAGFALLLFLLLLLALPVVGLYLLYRWLYARWVDAGGERRGKRVAIILAGALAISSPYLLFKAYELHVVLSRVPEPLHVSWIEYRLEKSWGIGMPGDNETGFVVYRMTGKSADWARSQGQHLGAMLPGGSMDWHPTPVDESGAHNRWHEYGSAPTLHSHKANLREYLDKYGFSIPLERGRDAEVNYSIQHPGSFYSYGRGGSVTIIDSKRGKIYFAYAG
jgi:hypothetical protein